jgi:C4-dicarboxylate transporter DctQ subunit
MKVPATKRSTALSRIRHLVNRLEEVLIAFLLAVMTALTALQVLLRYGFNTGLIWSLEATTYSFAWLVLLGMSYCVRTRTHIAVDLLVKRCAAPLRKLLGLAAIAVCLAYSVLMLYGSGMFVRRLYTLGNEARDLPVARWLLSIMLPIGFALLAWRFIQLGVNIWRGRVEGLGLAEKAPEKLLAAETRDAGAQQERPQ